jgi:hypothetical protein
MHGIAPGGERLRAEPRKRTQKKQDEHEAQLVVAFREAHPFASASEIEQARARIRGLGQVKVPVLDLTISAVKSVSVLQTPPPETKHRDPMWVHGVLDVLTARPTRPHHEGSAVLFQDLDRTIRANNGAAASPLLARKYSEIVWLRSVWTASTRHDAMVIIGLPNTYARPA